MQSGSFQFYPALSSSVQFHPYLSTTMPLKVNFSTKWVLIVLNCVCVRVCSNSWLCGVDESDRFTIESDSLGLETHWRRLVGADSSPKASSSNFCLNPEKSSSEFFSLSLHNSWTLRPANVSNVLLMVSPLSAEISSPAICEIAAV